ncbi:MAG: hypothetical protein KKE11_01015, partial [Gammaproteobacteria bacterium]|nr:hypothetical protein [Gammaproteobacteria bacterium]
MSLQSDYPEIFQKLNEIGDACSEAAKITDRKGQQKSKEAIEEQAKQFMVLLNSYKSDGRMDAEIYHVFGQELLDGIYDIVKLASKQNFGIIELTTDLPLDTIAEHQLTRLAERNAVASANLTQKARLNESGKLIFCKNTHPDVAQLEIVAAQFYRHTLDGRTAQGKVIVEAGRIVGMYVEAIPGFVSMRQLTDLAKNPSAYNEVDKKIQELSKDIETINEKIANVVGDSIQLKVQLEEKQNFLGVYTQIKELQLIDVTTGSVNIAKVPGIVAKALCSSFFCEDWDRHKDNFGISFANGKLGVASLDYDKSLSGIFGQDHKCYDWNITPKRLRDFPDFDCWYWPTSSNSFRKFFGSLVAPEKISKMYSESEAKQYSELKNNAEFKRQAQIEWLKVVFIPKELRQLAVSSLASTTCDSRLKNAPGILEEKRQA